MANVTDDKLQLTSDEKRETKPTRAPLIERPAGQMQIDREVARIQNRTKAELDKEEKVSIRLRTGPKNKPLDDAMIGINGYNYQIQRGVDVEVPRSVYDLLLHSSATDEDNTPFVVLPPAKKR